MLSILPVAMLSIVAMQAADAPKSANKITSKPDVESAKQPAVDLALQVRRLLRQLDAAQIEMRDRAFAELVKLGPDILPHLPAASENTPATVRDAVIRLRKEFDRQAADRAMQASTVTLQRPGVKLEEVVEEFTKQTGNKLVLDVEAATTVDLDLEKTPFWQALDTVAEKAKLSVYPYAQDGLRLQPAMPSQRPRGEGAFYSGPVRFEAGEIRLTRDERLAADGSLRIGLEISWEPRLRPITFKQKLAALDARDENGGKIPVQGEGELPALVHQGSSAVEMELPFQAPPRSVKSITSLQGTVEMLLPGKQETFEFTGLDHPKKTEQQRHNATVTLESVRKVNEVWEIRIRVKYQQAFSAFDSHLVSWILNNEAYLTDSKGERLENGGFETTNRSEDEIGVAYIFEAPQGLAAYKFMYQTPSTIYRLPVRYELKELALP